MPKLEFVPPSVKAIQKRKGRVYSLEVYSDHLAFRYKGRLLKTSDPRMIARALRLLGQIFLED